MLHLLKIEWLKIKNYRTFWVLTILFMISVFGINYLVLQIFESENIGPAAQMFMDGHPFHYPGIWKTVPWWSGFLLFLPGLLMIISITNEFSYKTHRQNVIDGLSRTQFISVKIVKAVLLALFSTVLVFLVGLFLGSRGAAPFSTTNMEYIGSFFIHALNATLLALVISLIFRRSGISIGVFFLYHFILEELIGALLKYYVGNIGFFLPYESGESTMPFPFLRRSAAKNTVDFPYDFTYIVITALIYLALYIFFSKRKFERADL